MLSFSVFCQTEPLKSGFIVELEQNESFPKKRFSIIQSISWQWIYTTNLMTAYELILTTKEVSPDSSPHSWPPVEVVFTVGWLLKSYWKPVSALFNPIELQAPSILPQEDQPFAIIITLFGSGHDQQQVQPSESSVQQAPKATIQNTGYFTHRPYSDSDDGDGNPPQYSHTMGLNCFVHPCHGVCRFQPSSESREAAEWLLNLKESSKGCIKMTFGQSPRPPYGINDKPTNNCNPKQSGHAEAAHADPADSVNHDVPMHRHLPLTAEDWVIVNGLLNLGCHSFRVKTGISFMRDHFNPPMETSETQQTTEGSTHFSHKPLHFSQKDTVQAKNNIRQKICKATVVGKNGQQRLCGKVCWSAAALSVHKSSYHSGVKICLKTVIGEDGQLRQCGKVCKHNNALSDHRRRDHTGQKTCEVTVIGEDGQQQPCGKVCKNAQALTDHKSGYHSGQRTCNATMVGEDGQPKLCGKILKNTIALMHHKEHFHSRKKTCDVTVIGEDGLLRPCGMVLTNARYLKNHKKRVHTGRQTCDEPLIGEDGQQRPCGKACKNVEALRLHKRKHRKRKPVDTNLD